MSMREVLTCTTEHDAIENGCVVLFCHNHDRERLSALKRNGGTVVGWVDGYYRVKVARRDG